MVLVRPRNPADVPGCVESLREVYKADDYPHRWPQDPAGWLTPENMVAAWVAEHDNRTVGHVVLVDKRPAEWTMSDGSRPVERIHRVDPHSDERT